jgi:hypothetical protein
MLIALISWIVDIDDVDNLDVDLDGNFSRYYRRCIDIWDDISIHRALVINIFQLL